MRLLAYDPIPNETAQDLGVEFVPLETLLQQSDYVSLHAAVTPETEGLISAPQLHLEAEQLPDQRRPRHVSERN